MSKVLILGASGNFGSAAARAFIAAGWEVDRYSRGADMALAAKGCAVIVNAMNPPMYHDWANLVPEITTHALAAGKASGARIVVPGNVYVYGNQPGPWGAGTPHVPCSRKGAIRAQMEARYRASGQKVLILRGGDFIDEASSGTILGMVVLKGLAKGKVTALGDPKARRAYAYLPDMARAMVMLAQNDGALPAFADVPYAGLEFSANDLRAEVERQLGRPVKLGSFPWWAMTLATPVWELAREMKEMRYLYNLPHGLDPEPLRALLPEFRDLDLPAVVTRHLRARLV